MVIYYHDKTRNDSCGFIMVKQEENDIVQKMQGQIELLQYVEQRNRELREFLEQRKHLIEGVALGLFFGIIGNIAVSHYYGLFERLVNGRFDNLLWLNLFSLVVVLVVVLVASWQWYKRLKIIEEDQKSTFEITNDIRKLLSKAKELREDAQLIKEKEENLRAKKGVEES
jgi:hypothetical protein